MASNESIIREYLNKSILKTLEPQAPKTVSSDNQDQWMDDWQGSSFPICIIGYSTDNDELDGSLLLCCEREFLEATCPRSWNEEEELYDWLGEMANQVLGRLKTMLLAHGVEIKLNPPSVSLSSIGILKSYAERRSSGGPMWVAVEGGAKIYCQFGFRFDDELQLEGREGTPASLQAGGSILNINPVKRRKKKKPQVSDSQSAAPAPSAAAPTMKAGPGLGFLNHVETHEGQITLGFESGFKFSIELAAWQERPSSQLMIGGQAVEVCAEDSEGVSITTEGISVYLPKVA